LPIFRGFFERGVSHLVRISRKSVNAPDKISCDFRIGAVLQVVTDDSPFKRLAHSIHIERSLERRAFSSTLLPKRGQLFFPKGGQPDSDACTNPDPMRATSAIRRSADMLHRVSDANDPERKRSPYTREPIAKRCRERVWVRRLWQNIVLLLVDFEVIYSPDT
jgi:hypothetical protein